jgi:hypothetical protein
MNAPFGLTNEPICFSVPTGLEAFARPPSLLPGESLVEYQTLRDAIFGEIVPQGGIEWLLTLDLVELSWDIQRFRLLRQKTLESYRQRAIEQTLRRIDCAGIPAAFENAATCYTKQNALSWRQDREAAAEIEARLAAYGFDQNTIDTEVYVQAREVFFLFESLLNSAQQRRIFLLREINHRRLVQKHPKIARL